MSLRTTVDFQLDQREKEGIWILDLRGRVTIGDSEATLRSAVVALAEAKAVSIILNLAGVTEIDDDGLGGLVFCYAGIRSFRRRAGCGKQLLSRSRGSPLRHSRVGSGAGKASLPDSSK